MTVGELALKRKFSQDAYEDYCAEIMFDLNEKWQYFDWTSLWKIRRVKDKRKETELYKELSDWEIEEIVESMGFTPKREYNA